MTASEQPSALHAAEDVLRQPARAEEPEVELEREVEAVAVRQAAGPAKLQQARHQQMPHPQPEGEGEFGFLRHQQEGVLHPQPFRTTITGTHTHKKKE